jgi:hypothetical protein
VHVRLAFLLLPSGDEVKTKNPPPSGSGLINFANESKPDRHAGQQRVRKQQIQIQNISLHDVRLAGGAPRIKRFS